MEIIIYNLGIVENVTALVCNHQDDTENVHKLGSNMSRQSPASAPLCSITNINSSFCSEDGRHLIRAVLIVSY